ncbi:MAG: ATP-binding protein [Chitinophagales bacterium]
MIKRDAQKRLEHLAKTFKAIAVIGPRQSGKTTLVKKTFPDKRYYSLENPDLRNFALEDPRGFLKTMPHGAILDEVQRTPELFSYLQEILDDTKEKGLFVLTGSNNFLLQQTISQTLSGRIGYIQLLPFSLHELKTAKLIPTTDEELIFTGFYPSIYDQQIAPADWLPDYIRTYIERDARQIKNISDLIVFEKFIRLLAGRTGQELNLSSLANETGVDGKTVQSWIGILVSSFIVFLLKPHHKNFNKTIAKRPKLYFYDTGLVCSLLGIRQWEQVQNYPLKGALFETMVVTELLKKRTNSGLPVNLFYWRDKTGHEIDVITDSAGKLLPIEIKSGKTFQPDFLKSLNYWKKLSHTKSSVLLYGGDQQQQRSDGTLITNWREITELEI